ncbi:unnamed protein product [Victoria cruziana]
MISHYARYVFIVFVYSRIPRSYSYWCCFIAFAVLFFSICSLMELACILLYAFVFPKLEIGRYFRSKAASEGSKTIASNLAAGGVAQGSDKDVENPNNFQCLSNKELLIQNKDYAIDLYLTYVLTLSIFPGFLYEDTRSHSLGSSYGLVMVAAYNVFDLIGRYTPLIKEVKITSRHFLTIACLSRFLLILAFYFTAKYEDQGWMIMLTSILGLTNGHLTICILTTAPKGYKGPEQNALGNLLCC